MRHFKSTSFVLTVILSAGLFMPIAHSADTPIGGNLDPRIRYVPYKKDDVVIVKVRRGTVTRIQLANDEKIVDQAFGFDSDCEKEQLEWCITLSKNKSQILVKPKEGATHNNYEIRTDKDRDYSLEFIVLPDAPAGRSPHSKLIDEPMHRVIFQYPVAIPVIPPSLLNTQLPTQLTANELIEQRLDTKPKPRNVSYSIEILGQSHDIAPSMVFDDGRFTYFRFPENREIPAIFSLSKTKEEAKVNFTVEDDFVVVQKLAPSFVLRLGASTVGIFNDQYNPDGVAANNGVTVDGVKRILKTGR
jgi:type IV secretion system protein VirB9